MTSEERVSPIDEDPDDDNVPQSEPDDVLLVCANRWNHDRS